MASPEEVVRALFGLINDKDLAGIENLLDEKVSYHNIGTPPSEGRDATVAALKLQFDMFDPIGFRVLTLAADGENVLTERVDEITANGVMAPVPAMGTHVVRDGKIVAWRDYFDMALCMRLMAGENASDVLPTI
jgi:limonene-1,2-epoxide hydrolase